MPSCACACSAPCATCSPAQWLDLRASPVFAAFSTPPPDLSPAWVLLLFGDCSPTRVIGLLSGAPLTVALLGMEAVGSCCDGVPFPSAVAAVAAPRVRRRVWLEARGERVGYAVSWWSEAALDTFLPARDAPIGDALGAKRLELHRELVGVARGSGHGALEAGLLGGGAAAGAGGRELWARWYLMFHGGAPVCLIHEVFSPALEQWMGPRRGVCAAPGAESNNA